MLIKCNSFVLCEKVWSKKKPKRPGIFFLMSFLCCFLGWQGNGYTCQDIDECAINNGGCSTAPMVQCINTAGSFRCGLCPPGKMDFLLITLQKGLKDEVSTHLSLFWGRFKKLKIGFIESNITYTIL